MSLKVNYTNEKNMRFDNDNYKFYIEMRETFFFVEPIFKNCFASYSRSTKRQIMKKKNLM